MMTGLYPRRHSMGFANGLLVLSGGETLAETFQRQGYDTAAFVSNAVLWARSGLNRGFAVYDDEFTATEANRPGTYERRAAQTLERALGWLARPRSKPFFLWVHFQDPHGPYTAPPPYGDQFHLPVGATSPSCGCSTTTAGAGAFRAIRWWMASAG
jgi:arylsulfatase A-like enzyme